MKKHIKKTFPIISLLIVLLITISCSERKQNETSVEKTIDSEIENWLAKTGVPSASIVLIKNGNISKCTAYGYANLKSKSPAQTSTIYNTGSNFKAVTATAIMQLAEKGLIDIDKPVNDYLKTPIEYIDKDFPITARHLMSHQSGIPPSINKNKVWERKSERTLQEIASIIRPNSKPKEKYQYSNDGYSLLGLLIENITGLTYEEYVWRNILKPLGIETYGFLNPTPKMIENLALPYHIRYNQAYPTDQLHLEQYPSGDIFLKPNDMAKFLIMHLNKGEALGKILLSNESIQKMHQANIKIEENFYYGLGFGINDTNGKKHSSHQGSLPGYLSTFTIDFETKSGVYIATNTSYTPLQGKQIQALLSYLHDYVKNDEALVELNVPIEDKEPSNLPNEMNLNKYVGNYNIVNTPVYLTIDKIGNQLFLINPAKERFEMEYLESNKFFITTENEDIEFEENNGIIENLTLFSGEDQIKAEKIKHNIISFL